MNKEITENFAKNYQALKNDLSLYLSLQMPICVYGEIGKTSFLQSIIKNPVIIDTREILDIRNLAGFYAIEDGEIIYVEGILITAMKEGNYILFKNIDKNYNLQYFLSSVIKHRKIVNNKGDIIYAEKSFNLFFTSRELFKNKDIYFLGPVYYSILGLSKVIKKDYRIIENIFNMFNYNITSLCDHKYNKDCSKVCLSENFDCFDGLTLCLSRERNLCSFHYKKILQLHKLDEEETRNSHERRLSFYDKMVGLFLKHDSENLLSLLSLNYYPDVVIYDYNIVKTYAYKLAIRNILTNIKLNKYSLLVGETGVGKTSLIQYICKNSKRYFNETVDLKIVNMSPDIDAYDLIGGYSSLNISRRITDLFYKHNICKPKVLDNKLLIKYLKEKVNDPEVDYLDKCIQNKINFIWKDGLLVDCMKNGHWILLDEINLCSEETLGMIDAFLEKKEIINYEKKTVQKINIHKNFMLFACMNPGNDHGKKDFLSHNFNQVTFFDYTDNVIDIKAVIKSYLYNIIEDRLIDNLAEIFYDIKQGIRKKELTNKIEPLISGRTIVRCLEAIRNNRDMCIMNVFSVFILTQFDLQSRSLVYSKLASIFSPLENKILPTYEDCGYILTPKIQIMMYDLITSIRLNYPILLQGDTSTGKTSIIFYLAEKQNTKVIRINNHEHTEATDYLGNYITTSEGIEFKESIFIEAVRKGWWVILDELNLTQSDVLEVLNRLLDDNKEIFIPQKNELIKAHPDFRLFATQNIDYAGRKGISKAFRNRFIEIFFTEKTDKELLVILHIKTKLPKSFCLNMIQIYTKLKNLRNIDCLITLRDLFKWANRIPRTMYEVFEIGLSIIYERQRSEQDKSKVLGVFKEVFIKLDTYSFEYSVNDFFKVDNCFLSNISKYIILTPSIIKLIKLLSSAIRCKEPILLIGETGIGKTKICEIIAKYLNRHFVFTNMHNGIESSDFLGTFTLEEGNIKWKDGPLLNAMRNGHFFLIDEINLAEDAVLERLNSLFEDKRELFVSEIDQNIIAHDNFVVVATMNPGNDFGKRELSPALRNRFTEIYFSLPENEIQQIFDLMLTNKNIVKPNFVKFSGSLRNHELFCEFYTCLQTNTTGLVKLSENINTNDIAKEAYRLAFKDKEIVQDLDFFESESILSIYPYFLHKTSQVDFEFKNKTTLVNLKKILRSLVVQKGILLEGEPGVGKTSIVTSLGKLLGKKCIRINLSEQTELSDLVGTYLPIENGIKFVPSQLSEALEKGWWIILDEINLCSQSVIEGLNSVLDYRKKLILPDLVINVHPETKIFATMNPFNNLNGRKILPKSFLDRFVTIYMDEYKEEDIRSILSKLFTSYIYYQNCSLRENIKLNTCCLTKTGIEYKISNTNFQLGNVNLLLTKPLSSDYVLVHSQLKQLEIIILSLIHKIPVIITGGFGKGSLMQFLSKLFNIKCFDFMCHRETDTSDILGQYHKSEDGLFVWKNSLFIENIIKGALIVLHNPELVEKSIFDRCNSLFETERIINIYEKGIDTDVSINSHTRFILLVDNISELSPALIDRCYVVELNSEVSYIDAWKIFYRNRDIYNKIHECDYITEKKFKISNMNFDNWKISEIINLKNFDLSHRKFTKFLKIPSFFNKNLHNIFNELIEQNIDEMFKWTSIETEFDTEKIKYLKFYTSINYNINTGKTDLDKLMEIKKVKDLTDTEKVITFIKNMDLDIFLNINNDTYNDQCILNIPISLQELKEKVLFSLQFKSLGDIPVLKEICFNLSEIRLDFNINFDFDYFEMLKSLDSDPLIHYKEYVTYLKNRNGNELLKKLYLNLKSLYKYGKGEINSILDDLDKINTNYQKEITKINIKLNRNFDQFKEKFINVDLCQYYTDRKSRSFYDQFYDIFDYYLIYLLNSRKYSRKCNGTCKELSLQKERSFTEYINQISSSSILENSREVRYKNLVANVLVKKDFIKDIKDFEYGEFGQSLCKFLYALSTKKPLDISSLVFEACLDNKLLNYKDIIDTSIVIPEKYINDCLVDVFKIREICYIIDNRMTTIHFTDNLINLLLDYKNLPIFTKPNDLFVKINDFLNNNKVYKTLQDNTNDLDIDVSSFIREEDEKYKMMSHLFKLLSKYFKSPESLTCPTNFKYFIFLEVHKFTTELAERYFLDCQLFEFFDRMKFAEEKSMTSPNEFYNIVLQYKAFEVENLITKRLSESKTKIRKEPKLYEKIRKDLLDFLTLPVTNILDLKFNKPQCCCKEKIVDNIFYKFIDKPTNEECVCLKLTNLSENFNRSTISIILQGINITTTKITKKDILMLFYKRKVLDRFSYSELCLAKVINKMTEDTEHLKLISLGIENPFPPFLYFVWNFADEDTVEYEDGTGIKSGTGEKNISDKIEDEEEISEEFCDKNEVEEDDGIDLDNAGSMSTVDESETEQNETGVDGDDSKEKKEEGSKEDDKSEDKCDFEENEGYGESGENDIDGIKDLNDDSSGSNDSLNNQNNKDLLNDVENTEIKEDKNDIPTEYKYTEGVLNQNQTCDEAIDYDRRVYGDLPEEALCPGQGNEEIEGNHKEGDKTVSDFTINISYKELYSNKLVLLLRNILESNKYNKYKGDYKSGKKLNMKRLIPYIASDYKKDKIWMKRRKNDKKDYIIRIFIDNSRSMYSQEMIDILLKLYSILKNSFIALNIPVKVYRFGNVLEECEIRQMTFMDSETNIDWIEDFKDGVNIVLTDGVFQKTGFYNRNFLIILIDKNDILNMSKVSVTEGNIFIQRYLDLFSMKYCVIKDLKELESTFILALSELIKNY